MEELGVSLKDLKETRINDRFSLKTVVMIGLQFLKRLKDLHSMGYVHRDLKPANTLIGKKTSDRHIIYLVDYGIAKKQDEIL